MADIEDAIITTHQSFPRQNKLPEAGKTTEVLTCADDDMAKVQDTIITHPTVLAQKMAIKALDAGKVLSSMILRHRVITSAYAYPYFDTVSS